MDNMNNFVFKDNDPEYVCELLMKDFIEITSQRGIKITQNGKYEEDVSRIKQMHEIFSEIGYDKHVILIKEKILKLVGKDNNDFLLVIDGISIIRLGGFLANIITEKEFDEFYGNNKIKRKPIREAWIR